MQIAWCEIDKYKIKTFSSEVDIKGVEWKSNRKMKEKKWKKNKRKEGHMVESEIRVYN